MKNFLKVTFWILTDVLLVLSIALFPSLFSVFGILAVIIFIPIEEWQDLIKKYIKKPIRSAILAVVIAFVIAFFPITEIIAGLNNLKLNSQSTQNSSIIYKEESAPPSSDFFNISSNPSSNISSTSFEDNNTSNKADNNTTSEQLITTSKIANTASKTSQTISKESKITTVYRAPKGKKYHFSSTCGGKNSYEVSYDDAINSDLTPCKKCVK